MSPDMELLKTFVAVVDKNGFTRASEGLHRTQSTISLHIKRLEQIYGCTLFVRTKRGATLTGDGELLLGYSRRMLDLHREAQSRLCGTKVEGLVRVGVPEDFATDQLPRVLRRFRSANPGVKLDVRTAVTAELMAALNNGDLDGAVARRGESNPGGELLWTEPLVWAGPIHERLELQRPIPLVMFPHGCVYRPMVLDRLQQGGKAWHLACSSTSLEGVRAAVRAGLGVTAIALSTITKDLRLIDNADDLPALGDTEIALFRRAATRLPAMEALFDVIREDFAKPALTLAVA